MRSFGSPLVLFPSTNCLLRSYFISTVVTKFIDTMKKESNSLLEDRQPDRISDVGIEIVDPLNRMELDRITYLHFWTTIFAPSTKKAVLINSNVLRSHKEEKDEECRDHKPNKKPHEK
jgi:hypothetical protein